MEMPSYYTITPAPIRYSDAPPREILMYGEITALSNKYGYCTASNGYFAKVFRKDDDTVSKWITDMVKRGWIRRELIREGKQVKQRRLYLNPLPISEEYDGYPQKIGEVPPKSRGGYPQKIGEGTPENTGDNNININNTSINSCSSGSNYAAKESTAWIELEKLGIHPGRQIYIKEDFLHYVHKLTDEVVKYAVLNMAKEIDKPNWNYLDSVLYRYEQEGINTLEKAKQDDERYRQRKKKQYSGYRRNPKPRIDLTDPHRFDDM